jgi:hypothetical protein
MMIEVRITIENRDNELGRDELVDVALHSNRLDDLDEMAERVVKRAKKAIDA